MPDAEYPTLSGHYKPWGIPISARVYNSVDLAIANTTVTALSFDSERFDTHSMHFTSSAALTGSHSTTAGSPTLTGSSSSFTTELSVGQMISISGEVNVIKSIESDTSATCVNNFGSSWLSTASRYNKGLVCPVAGKYLVVGNVRWAANATGRRDLYLVVNGATTIGAVIQVPVSGTDPTDMIVSALWDFEAGDYVELQVYQSSGGALNVSAAGASPEFSMVRLAS